MNDTSITPGSGSDTSAGSVGLVYPDPCATAGVWSAGAWQAPSIQTTVRLPRAARAFWLRQFYHGDSAKDIDIGTSTVLTQVAPGCSGAEWVGRADGSIGFDLCGVDQLHGKSDELLPRSQPSARADQTRTRHARWLPGRAAMDIECDVAAAL